MNENEFEAASKLERGSRVYRRNVLHCIGKLKESEIERAVNSELSARCTLLAKKSAELISL